MLIQTGCTIKSTTRPAESVPASIVVPDPNPGRIDQLLGEARDAFDRQHLTTPVDNNAYLRYLQVLALDPDNAAANHGIADIVEKYLDWAIQNARGRNMHKAIDYLNKAKSVDETHPNIASAEILIAESTKQQRIRIMLDETGVASRSDTAKRRLQEIAVEIQRLKASVVIKAPSDNHGRWIYQQLNENAASRVSANFEYHPSPQIIVVY
jgi:hypothetical protein